MKKYKKSAAFDDIEEVFNQHSLEIILHSLIEYVDGSDDYLKQAKAGLEDVLNKYSCRYEKRKNKDFRKT